MPNHSIKDLFVIGKILSHLEGRGVHFESVTRRPGARAPPPAICSNHVIEDTEFAIQVMMELKVFCVLLSIDDFGSGYSSLSYLKPIPFDFLKIDRSFIKDLASNDIDESILVAISALARSMKLGLIAEGVEDEAQFNRLQNKGCDELQGFLFSTPIPSDEFEDKYFPAPHLRTGYCQLAQIERDLRKYLSFVLHMALNNEVFIHHRRVSY